MTITELLDTIDAQTKAATAGPWLDPWIQDKHPARNAIMTAGGSCVVCVSEQDPSCLEIGREDSAFIAAARMTVPQLVALLREACRLLAEAPCDCIWQDQPDGSQKHHPLCSLVRARKFLAREVQP